MNIFLEHALQFSQNKPDQVIVIDKWRSWTWSDIVSRAYHYRNSVINNFPVISDIPAIPLLVGRGGEVVACVLVILLAGRAAAPLSSLQPADRLKQCLNKLGTLKILDARTLEERQTISSSIELLDPTEPSIDMGNQERITEINVPETLLYILFTSGSTGEPKGVMVSHQNILNTMLWSTDYIDWKETDVIGGATQFSFDIANFDLFSCLYYGVPLSLFPKPSDVRDVIQRISDTRVTSIFAVPAFFSQFVRAGLLDTMRGSTLRRILAGGDFSPPTHTLEWLRKTDQIDIYNVWGPTETSIVNTMHRLTDSDHQLLEQGHYASIGAPHPRMPMVLVDESGVQIQEPNERGEIWMLGDCVSLGYLGGSDSENQAYVEYNGQRGFRTNDIGYMDEDGLLYLVGRTGSTIKLSGYRVDLGDVERALACLPDVHMAGAFVTETTPGITELWAAVELKPGIEEFQIYTAKRTLRKVLPNYMVPKRLFTLHELPLNSNGKVDRQCIKKLLSTGIG